MSRYTFLLIQSKGVNCNVRTLAAWEHELTFPHTQWAEGQIFRDGKLLVSVRAKNAG